MSFNPHWRQGATGMFPIDAETTCAYCKSSLKKLHGLNQNRPGQSPSVMGWFFFGAGPFCIHCGEKMWTDPDFFKRSGSNEYHSSRYDLNRDFRSPSPSK